MSQADALGVLNELLAMVYRSLPMYLHDAQPWHSRAQDQAANVLQRIVNAQQETAMQIAGLILDRGGQPHAGVYPTEFSSANWHFVSLQFLLRPLLEHQARDVARIENCVAQLAGDREAREIAEEALGSARAHLELLEGLVNSETGS